MININYGIVTKKINGYYYIESENNIFECKIKGIIKRDNNRDTCISGDKVEFCPNEQIITKVLPRNNMLNRPLVANIDNFFITFAAKDPDLDFNKLAVIVLNSLFYKIKPIILINKTDLLTTEELNVLENKLSYYLDINIPYYFISTITKAGITNIFSHLNGTVSAFGGPSGVGKSSILNSIQDNIKLSVGEISNKIKRGKHTTRDTTLIKLDAGGYVIDTPGFSFLDIPEIKSFSELLELFPDINGHTDNCKFKNCRHISEPQCSVKDSVESGIISNERYQFYKNTFLYLKEERWNTYD